MNTRDIWFPMGEKHAIENICKFLREMADSGEWPNGRPFFNPAEGASVARCATEIEERFLKKEEEND
jgi:hypothetical protein